MLASAEITRHNRSVIACSCHIYMGVILRPHPIRGESHIQRNANREFATVHVHMGSDSISGLQTWP